jgi:ABC-2 type transport system ATP-binding protein
MTTEYALTLCDVSGRGVHGLSLALAPGEIAGMVGSASAGKTTVLQIAAGKLRPDRGTVRVCGITASAPVARRLVGYASEATIFPPAIKVREALAYYARLHGEPLGSIREVLDFAGLDDVADRRVSALGSCDLHRLSLAQAVLGGRRVVLLDEILSGVDAVVRRDLRNRIARLACSGVAVLLAARDPGTLGRLAVRVLVLRRGQVVRAGPLSALLAERVLEVILDAPPVDPPPGFRVTATGLEAPLTGRTVEAALALCHAHRLPVRASRVRVKSLEDIVLETHDAAG